MQHAISIANSTEWNAAALLRSTWLTATLGLVTIVASLTPGAAELLQFDRTAIAQGEVWRLVTGNFVHWNVDHLFWDCIMFVALGAAIEFRHRGAFLAATALSACAVSATAWCIASVDTYRGLSGIDSALFVLLAGWYLIDALRSRCQLPLCIPIALLLGFFAKIGYEILTGRTYFVDSTAALFTPLPQVHLAGAAVALRLLLAYTESA
jgi:rhomboid family GlyGly-CTERM serine protease